MIYSGNIEATKITSDWYLWIHHTVNKIPNEEIHKFAWKKNIQKIKLELLKAINQSKSKKIIFQKNMNLGKKIKLLIVSLVIFNQSFMVFSEEKITSSPLINLEKLKPSFEEIEENSENIATENELKQKKSRFSNSKKFSCGVNWLGQNYSKIIKNYCKFGRGKKVWSARD